jgi:hypothetical protein
MSRGLGIVQMRILTALQAELGKQFTVEQLCSLVFPGEVIQTKHRQSVRRAIRCLRKTNGLQVIRAGHLKSSGWHLTIRCDV